MPSFSATDRAPTAAGIKPVATSASHPSAAAATVSNCAATNSAASRGTSVRRRRRRPVHQRAHRLPDRHQRHADLGQQLREVRRRAHPHLRAEFPQPHRESHHRFDVPARPLRRQQHTHFASPHFRRFWPRPAILRHDPGLAASPRVRYRLKVGRSWISLPFLLSSAGGRAVSSRSAIRRGPR